MESSYLFSIGHGNKSIAEFIAELTQFDIQYLIDIRSKPYSKFYPWFNHYELKHAISETHKITYAYMGDVLGGLPKEDCGCYTDGKVDYSKLASFTNLPADQHATYETNRTIKSETPFRYVWFKINGSTSNQQWVALAEWQVFKVREKVIDPELDDTTIIEY